MPLEPPSDNVPSVKEFVAAVKKNNYPQTTGSLFQIRVINDVPKLYACAAGQGLLNLELITEQELIEAFKEASIAPKDNLDRPPYRDEPYDTMLDIDRAWATWLNDEFNDTFAKVWIMNDREHLTPQEIGEKLEKSLDD